jgi:hypothetical protein
MPLIQALEKLEDTHLPGFKPIVRRILGIIRIAGPQNYRGKGKNWTLLDSEIPPITADIKLMAKLCIIFAKFADQKLEFKNTIHCESSLASLVCVDSATGNEQLKEVLDGLQVGYQFLIYHNCQVLNLSQSELWESSRGIQMMLSCV